MMMTKRASFSIGAALGLAICVLILSPAVVLGGGGNPCVAIKASPSFEAIDHNLCFKTGKRDLKVRGELDLYTFQFGFFMGCTIWETWMACAPANKEVVELKTKMKGQKKQDTEPLPLGAPIALGNFDTVCYRLKCDKKFEDVTLLDQFGTRTIKSIKPLVLCNPAVKVCKDPDRPNYVGSCSELDGDPEGCQQAWQATGDGLASSCTYDSGSCFACGSDINGLEASNGPVDSCLNTCVTCAQSQLVQANSIGACRQFDGDQEACESHWSVGGFGPHQCYFDAGDCRGCGPANELEGKCSNQCRS